MDPSIKFDDYSAEDQALMKSAPYVMKPLRDWHYKDVLHFFKTNVTNEKSCIKAYILKSYLDAVQSHYARGVSTTTASSARAPPCSPAISVD